MDKNANKITSSISSLIYRNIHYKLFALGVIIIFIGNLFELILFKVDIDSIVTNIGALMLVTGMLQWMFDNYLKKDLFEEIIDHTIGNTNIRISGLKNVHLKSTDVDYRSHILSSQNVTFCFNFSSRILEDYYTEFRERAKQKLTTKVVYLDYASDAATFVNKRSLRERPSSLKKLDGIIEALLAIDKHSVQVLTHSSILSYSFFATEQKLWIIPYINSKRYSGVPSLELESGSPLFDHYREDIEFFIENHTRPVESSIENEIEYKVQKLISSRREPSIDEADIWLIFWKSKLCIVFSKYISDGYFDLLKVFRLIERMIEFFTLICLEFTKHKTGTSQQLAMGDKLSVLRECLESVEVDKRNQLFPNSKRILKDFSKLVEVRNKRTHSDVENEEESNKNIRKICNRLFRFYSKYLLIKIEDHWERKFDLTPMLDWNDVGQIVTIKVATDDTHLEKNFSITGSVITIISPYGDGDLWGRIDLSQNPPTI